MSSIISVGAVWSLAVCANIWYIESNGRVPPWVPDVDQRGDYQSLLSKMHRKHSNKVIRGLCKNRTIPRIISNPYSSDSSGTTVQRCSKCKWIHSPFFSSQRQPGLHGGTIDLPTIFRICESFEHEPWQKWHPESSKSPLSWSMVTRMAIKDGAGSWTLDWACMLRDFAWESLTVDLPICQHGLRLNSCAVGGCTSCVGDGIGDGNTCLLKPDQLGLHVLQREGERHRERERPTDRQTDSQPASQPAARRQTGRRTDGQTQRQRQKEKETERDRKKQKETERDRERERGKHIS